MYKGAMCKLNGGIRCRRHIRPSTRPSTHETFLILVRQFFERESLGLGQEEGGKDTREHEERKDLETIKQSSESQRTHERKEINNAHMLHKLAWSSDILQLTEPNLRHNRSKLPTRR